MRDGTHLTGFRRSVQRQYLRATFIGLQEAQDQRRTEAIFTGNVGQYLQIPNVTPLPEIGLENRPDQTRGRQTRLLPTPDQPVCCEGVGGSLGTVIVKDQAHCAACLSDLSI